MMTGYSVMITPENVMIKRGFLVPWECSIFASSKGGEDRRNVYNDEQIFQYYNE